MGKKQQKKQKIILPPDLPPETADDEVDVSDEDLQYVRENCDYADFVSSLDTQSITKHVTRVADVKGDVLEALYEKRLKKKLLEEKDVHGIKVDPVDALPVKTLEGELYYRRVSNQDESSYKGPNQVEAAGGIADYTADINLAKLTKAEKRAKLKKSKRETKKLKKDPNVSEYMPKNPQSEVLEEVKEELSAEEALEKKKCMLAELGIALLSDPESHIKNLKVMSQISKENDVALVKLGLLSLLAVFKDIIPGYRIRLPTEKEQQLTVSKAVRKTRFYESTLLSSYKEYLQKLMIFEKKPVYNHVAVRCICTLLEAVPHFNFRENLLSVVVKNLSSADDVVRNLCCATIKSLFSNEGKHRGEATVAAVQMIAEYVKDEDCQLHPDSIEVFLSLSFDEDLGKPDVSNIDDRKKVKSYKGKKQFFPSKLRDNDKKGSKQDMLAQIREEVSADFKAASLTSDVLERKQMQSDTLSAIFEIYFRILKRTMQPIATRPDVDAASHPLLAQCLIGIGKFSHLIDIGFMGDLMNFLKKLACAGSNCDDSAGKSLKCLTVSERLECCIVAFKVMKNNLDALKVDLRDFHVQLYNLILEFRHERDRSEVLVEALKIMLCEDRQHDMQRAAAFIKRLAMFTLCFGSAESMAALVTLKHLLEKNVKCRNLLENDAGGGSVSGSIAKYDPYVPDPNQSGALASVLWELVLLSEHYHPQISSLASQITKLTAASHQVHSLSPPQVFLQNQLDKITQTPPTFNFKCKRKRANIIEEVALPVQIDEQAVRKNLSHHFILLRGITENERLRKELERTNMSLRLYRDYRSRKIIKNIN